MAVEGRTLDVQYGNTKTYYTVTNLDIDVSLLGSKMPLRLWLNTTGTATYTAAAKAILFPNQYHTGSEVDNFWPLENTLPESLMLLEVRSHVKRIM